MEHKKDKIQKNTPSSANKEIDAKTRENVKAYRLRTYEAIEERINKLEKEWDIERALQTNASILIIAGCFLGAFKSRKWLILPFVITSFLSQHAVQGWCPPIPLLRKLGFRSRQEIDREIYALKALRGDFKNIGTNYQKALDAANT